MTQPTITPALSPEALEQIGFKQITGSAGDESCLFLRKEAGGGKRTVSLADPSLGVIFTMQSASWLELLHKIRAGKIK